MNNESDFKYLLLIGAMKAGTSSLYEYLSLHPEICASQIKEPEFFSVKQKHGRKLSNYNDLWPTKSSEHKYLMEASTGYTKYPFEQGVASRIHKYGLKPKFIYVVRDPFSRIESHFNFMKARPGWQLTITDEYLINISNYYLQLSQYIDSFGKESILVIDFDVFVDEPSRVLKNIYTFLDIRDGDFVDKYYQFNKTSVVSPAERFLRKMTKFKFIKTISPDIKKAILSVLRSFYSGTHAKLSLEQRAFVASQLEEDMLKLKSEFGVNVDKWGF